MIKYLAMSAVIVLGIGVVVAAWVNRDLIRIKMASVYARVAPKPGASSPASSGATASMSGDAPWALSALPECFEQLSVDTGPRAFLLRHLPAGSVRVAHRMQLRKTTAMSGTTNNGEVMST